VRALFYVVTIYGVVRVAYRRVLDWMIGFIDTSGLQAIIELPLFPRTLHFTVTYAQGFSDFANRILATDL
jgi:hypothetical protein